MRVMLIEVAEEFVETLARGNAFASVLPQPPFAEQARGVTRVFQCFGHSAIGSPQAVVGVPPDIAVAGVEARHQHAAQGAHTVEPA